MQGTSTTSNWNRFVNRPEAYTYRHIGSEPPTESTVQRMLRFNNWIAVLALCAMIAWSYVILVQTGEQPVPFGLLDENGLNVPRDTAPGGGMWVIMEVFLALVFYRKGGQEARGASAIAGLFLLAGLAVFLGSASPHETSPSGPLIVIIYVIASHGLYAVAGSSRRLGHASSDVFKKPR